MEFGTVVFGDDELDARRQWLFKGRGKRMASRKTTYRVPFAERSNIEERKGFVALEDLHRGDLTCMGGLVSGSWRYQVTEWSGPPPTLDDLAEDADAGHCGTQGATVLCWTGDASVVCVNW